MRGEKTSMIKLNNVSKAFGERQLFSNINLEVVRGEFLGIKGESGTGKSTLLNIIGLLEDCEGEVIIGGKVINRKDTKTVRNLLRSEIGYLFQNFALVDDLTVYENLKIVMDGISKKRSRALILQELKKVGLGDILDKKVFQLSGGEQQRVAIVRLILHKSEIVLADEPTGSLDKKNAKTIMDMLKELHNQGKTIIMVSHDESAFCHCSRVIKL